MSKTIFHPGKAVTTQWLNSSQYLGPSNPGVVFVANPINDYEYPLLKASSFDLPDIFTYFVGTTSNQTVDGEKTFLIPPKVPTPTLATGLQVVNIDRLNTDLAANTVLFNNSIAATNASLAALSASLPNSYVTTGNTPQTITGQKTFGNILVPVNPVAIGSPISLQYFDNNVVSLSNDQSINGTKTFNQSPQVPNPDSAGDAVNYQTLLNAVGGLINPSISEGCIKLGSIQIVFGSFGISGNWQAGGALNSSIAYSAVAPNMLPYTSISGAGSSIDRLVTLQTNYDNTGISVFADEPNSVNSQLANGTIRFIVIGYTS